MSGAALIRADALRLPLADESVDLVVTSPPFWALRSYSDAGEHYPGQLGSEPHWRDFLAALWAATAEMARVLKPGGSIFLNLGDKYSGDSTPGGIESSGLAKQRGGSNPQVTAQRPQHSKATDARPKSLLLLPELYRAGCTGALAALGGPDPGLNLIARAVIVQNKLNGLPESVTDRVRRSHEDWVHLTREPRYYSAVDEIRETPNSAPLYERGRPVSPKGAPPGPLTAQTNGSKGGSHLTPEHYHPLGKLPGSVWSLPSEPLLIPEATKRALNLPDHYAAFGTEIVRRIILGWSPPGICTECGHGRVPVVEQTSEAYEAARQEIRQGRRTKRTVDLDRERTDGGPSGRASTSGASSLIAHGLVQPERTILGYACPCTPSTRHPGTGEGSGEGYNRTDRGLSDGGYPDAGTNGNGRGHTSLQNRPKVGPWTEWHLEGWKAPPTRPAVILDPFVGSGTTVLVAKALGRFGVGLDLSADYLRLARWRIWDSQAASKAISRTNLERQGALL